MGRGRPEGPPRVRAVVNAFRRAVCRMVVRSVRAVLGSKSTRFSLKIARMKKKKTYLRMSGRLRRRKIASRMIGETSRWESFPSCRNSNEHHRWVLSYAASSWSAVRDMISSLCCDFLSSVDLFQIYAAHTQLSSLCRLRRSAELGNHCGFSQLDPWQRTVVFRQARRERRWIRLRLRSE